MEMQIKIWAYPKEQRSKYNKYFGSSFEFRAGEKPMRNFDISTDENVKEIEQIRQLALEIRELIRKRNIACIRNEADDIRRTT